MILDNDLWPPGIPRIVALWMFMTASIAVASSWIDGMVSHLGGRSDEEK